MVYSRQQNGDTKPETGLAEWTSRIKALQRQVDADEEAEQKSLEEEIAASRLARMRRNNRSATSLNAPQDVESSPKAEDPLRSRSPGRTPIERPKRTQSPLQPSFESPSLSKQRTKSFNSDKSANSDKQPMSLAAFIGGRASGPRLNKHAPQQDVPFEQVTTNRSVHPVFGAGGVAMPGMAALPSKSPKFPKSSAMSSSDYIPSTSDRHFSASHTPKHTPRRTPSPDKPSVRERTVTLPATTAPQIKPPSLSSSTSVSSAKKMFEMDIPKGERTRAVSLAPKIIDRPPVTQTPPSSSKSPAPQDFSPRPTSGGRSAPIQSAPWSQPRATAPTSPPQKEVTPSISRLQGRGFVQNMVKKNAQLHHFPEVAEEGQHVSKPIGRTQNVLDRWKPPGTTDPTPPPSLQPPTKRSPTVSATVDNRTPSPVTNTSQTTVRMVNPSPIISPKPILSPKPVLGQDPSAPKLGSATTMHLYKPALTPAPPAVDELGFGGSPKGKDSAISGFPASPLKPLYHPTKDRAKVSRKRKSAGQGQVEKPVKQSMIENPPQTGPQGPSKHRSTRSADMKVPEETEVPRRTSPGPAARAVSPSLASRMAAFQQSTGSPKNNEKAPSYAPRTQAKPVQPRQEEVSLKPTPVTQASRKGKSPERPTAQTSHPPANDVKPLSVPTSSARARSRSRSKSPQNVAPISAANIATKQENGLSDRPPVKPSEGHKRSRSKSISAKATPPLEPSNDNSVVPLSVPSSEVRARSRSRSRSPRSNATSSKTDGAVKQRDEVTTRQAKSELTREKRKSRTKSIVADAAPSLATIQETEGVVSERLLRCLLARPAVPSLKAMYVTISVEVSVIIGNSANMIPSDRHSIFHDTEILVVIHRSKSNADELVVTQAWGWEGKRAKLGEREQRKIQEIGQRYGTTVNMIQQGFEPRELVEVLGSTLITRQGPRNHWSTENAAMHQVRSLNGVMYIDEKELNIEHLCSAFSFCVTFMDAVYIWYGRGSTKYERRAARKYAESLNTNVPPTELEEGQDNNELFWVILGTDEYSDADYWRWRSRIRDSDPKIWKIDTASKELVTPIEYLGNETSSPDSVYLLDCYWEFYVLVGSNARLRRKDIGMALRIASELSTRLSGKRPFKPTTHAIFLPSKIPRDLRSNLRDLDELSLNTGEVPDHMNVFPLLDILSHFSPGP